MSSVRPVVAHLFMCVCLYLLYCLYAKKKQSRHKHTTTGDHSTPPPRRSGSSTGRDLSPERLFKISRFPGLKTRVTSCVLFQVPPRGDSNSSCGSEAAMPQVGPQVPQAVGRLHDNFPSSQAIEAGREYSRNVNLSTNPIQSNSV